MNNSTQFKMIYKTFFHLCCCAFLGFITTFLLFKHYISDEIVNKWNYSIPQLYAIFFLFSTIILAVILIARKKNLDYVGYTYLILTSIKLGVSYFFLKPILASTNIDASLEKKSFFIVFIYFLAIETFLTIRILNNKP